MTAPTVVHLTLGCQSLQIFSDLGNPSVHVEVSDVAVYSSSLEGDADGAQGFPLLPSSGDISVGTTEVKEGTECLWETPVSAELYLDARRGLKFAVWEGEEALCSVCVPMNRLLMAAFLEVRLACTGGHYKGDLTIKIEERKDLSGELWLSGVGLQGQGAYHDANTTYLSIREKETGVQIARSAEVWDSLAGVLDKFSTGKKTSFFKNWKARWVVATRAGLKYYEHAEQTQPKGQVHFDTTCVSPPFGIVSDPNPTTHPEVKDPSLAYFAVQCVDAKKPLTILFKAADHATRTTWCDFLAMQMDQAEGAPSTWPVARIPASVLRNDPKLEVSIVLKEGTANGRSRVVRNEISCAVASAADVTESRKVQFGSGGAEGSITFSRVRRKRPTVRDAFLNGHDINLSCALDFTAANGDSKLTSSLHSTHAGMNDYLRVVREVVAGLHPFAHTQPDIAAYGFGGSLETGGFSSRFPLDREGVRAKFTDFADLQRAYCSSLERVQLFDPRNFSPATRAVVEESRLRTKCYSVMVIIACGDPRDTAEFEDVLAESSTLPVTVIVIGVGGGSFEKLKALQQGVSAAPVVSPVTRVSGRRVNFRFVRYSPGDTAALQALPTATSSAVANNPASSVPTYDLASALSALPYHILDWARVAGKKLDEPGA